MEFQKQCGQICLGFLSWNSPLDAGWVHQARSLNRSQLIIPATQPATIAFTAMDSYIRMTHSHCPQDMAHCGSQTAARSWAIGTHQLRSAPDTSTHSKRRTNMPPHLLKIQLDGDLRIMEIPTPPSFAGLVKAVAEAYAVPDGNGKRFVLTYRDADGDEVRVGGHQDMLAYPKVRITFAGKMCASRDRPASSPLTGG